MSSAAGCSFTNGPSADWHPKAISEYIVPVDGTPPPWSVSDRPDPFGIAAGPDGNMWFAEPIFNRIGNITPDGRVTMYPDVYGLTEGFISRVAAARDGVWVLSGGIGGIGHIGRDGVLKRYGLPTDRGTRIDAIFSGPDYRVWALTNAYREGSGISELLPSGTLRKALRFTPTYDTITSIIAVADGTFWISASLGRDSAIEHVFADGRVVACARLAGAFFVVPGPHGTVIAQGIKYLTRLSADGAISTFYPNLNNGGIIGGVATAPDGTIWVTKADGTGNILKIDP